MLKRVVVLGAAALGCSGVYLRGRPGAGVDADVAGQWGCSAPAVTAAADTMKGKPASARVPRQGWTACDVLAAVGVPDSTGLTRSGGETSATWCYQNYAGAVVRQVLLVRRDTTWTVDAVTTWREISTARC